MTGSNGAPRVTIIVTQRERASAMRESIESVYGNTDAPFELIYVAGQLPGAARRWLRAEAAKRSFRVIDAGRALTPAEARNLGLAEARGDFVVFIENDVIPKEGWLDALLICADDTGADAVVPLTCEGRPLHSNIHHVGPVQEPLPGADGAEAGARDYGEIFHLQGWTRDQASEQLVRRRTQTCEFHCVMVRRSLFADIGVFDPVIVSKEHLDFSWRIAHAGGSIWVEPKAVVTFLVPSVDDPIRWDDLPYFLLRWSPRWQRRSHDRLKEKWGMQEAGFISSRRSLAGWRISHHVLKPALARTPVVGGRWGFVERGAAMIYPAAAFAAAAFAWRYERRSGRGASKDGARAAV